MAVQHTDGSLNITIVDGTALVGLFAADGSLNVFQDDGNFLGVYHPSGALIVSPANGMSHVGMYTASGGLNVVDAATATDPGLYDPISGCWRVNIIAGVFT